MNIMTSIRTQPFGLPANRYLSWRLINGRKVPCDAAGNVISAYDERYWCSWEEAYARPWGIATVITPDDGFVFIDLDKVLRAGVAPHAIIAAMDGWFPGAYRELSQSGTGLHYIFRADVPEGHGSRCKAWPVEFYCRTSRMLCLNRDGGTGRADIDYTDRMPAFLAAFDLLPVPQAPLQPLVRDPLWQGPEDDAELVKLMLAQPLRAPGKLSMAQKWTVDHAALAVSEFKTATRSDGLRFDHSALDLAVMSDLAYYCGRDGERMVRMFKAWPGYRPAKYERARGYHMNRLLVRASTNKQVLGGKRSQTVGQPSAPGQAVGMVAPAGTVAAYGTPGEFLAFLPDRTFYHRPTGAFWPVGSVDDSLPGIPDGTDAGGMPKITKPSKWLARHQPIHQRTWFPGQPEIIEGYVIRDGELSLSPGKRILNTYKPPSPPMGNGADIGPYLAHVQKLYPADWIAILRWMCFVAQNPGKKINHALVLGGAMRIGKDTILDPLVRTVGDWNAKKVSPEDIMTSQFNDWLECILLIIDEAKDTGGESKYQFYDKMKPIIATASKKSHRINPKGKSPYIIPNMNNTVMTTNYLTNGMHMVITDGRHYIAWSDATINDGLTEEYFTNLYHWLDNGGRENVAAYLMGADVSDFNPKALPFKTPAFYEMCNSGKSTEHHDLSDVIDMITDETFSLDKVAATALAVMKDVELSRWLIMKSNYKKIERMLSEMNVVKHINPDSSNGKWWDKERQMPVRLWRKIQAI